MAEAAVGLERGAGCFESHVLLPEATAKPAGQGEKKGKVARRAGAKPAPRRALLAWPSPPQGPAGQRELALLPRSCVAFPVPAGVPRNGRWEGRLRGFSCENTSGNSEFLTVKN